jgi:hypothetical protein
VLCRGHSFELEILFYRPYRFFNGDYSVFDCGSMAFSAANLKPLVPVCSSLPGEPRRTQFSGGSGAITGGWPPSQNGSRSWRKIAFSLLIRFLSDPHLFAFSQ